jgi:hypothetical protein
MGLIRILTLYRILRLELVFLIEMCRNYIVLSVGIIVSIRLPFVNPRRSKTKLVVHLTVLVIVSLEINITDLVDNID